MRSLQPVLTAALLVLSGCASVDVQPLNADGTADKTKERGIRYYLPAPYLLVAELPATAVQSGQSGQTGTAAAGAGGGSSDSSKSSGADTGSAATPSSSPQDTSFSASMVQYSLKLVYLPDFSHPMALKVHSGLLGTVSAAPVLTDGWMLSSLSSTANSGVADTLTALGGLINGGSSSSGKASGAATTAATLAAAGPVAAPTTAMDASTTDWEKTGEAVGDHTLAFPSETTLAALATKYPNNLQAFYGGVAKGIETLAKGQAVPAVTTWGNNVLPPGLYKFAYDETTGEKLGKFTGLQPVVFFCKDGPALASAAQAVPAAGATPAYSAYKTSCPHDPSRQ